jgi:predicted nuclease of predicted toxin-antitoxin system
MKLLIDMNLSPKWVFVLKEAGLEAAHWSSIGRSDAPDYEILAYARSNGYKEQNNRIQSDTQSRGVFRIST